MPSTYVDNVNTGHPARLSDVHPASCDKGAAGESSGNLRPPPAGDPVHQPGKSFASLAADIAVSKPAFSFKQMVRGRHQADFNSIQFNLFQ